MKCLTKKYISNVCFILLFSNLLLAQEKKHGTGEVSEIIIPTSANIRSNFNLFYEIHLSRSGMPSPSFWYKIIFSKDCSFEFTLLPISEDDGYDFYFYKIESNLDFCSAVNTEKVIPCNAARIHKTYHDTEQSQKFRANLVDVKPIQVKAEDAIYIEVFSTRGRDCGHVLDFRTTDNSFVVKVINDNCSGNKNLDTNSVGKYKPLVTDEKQAINALKTILCSGKKPVFISSIQINNKNVSVQKKLDFAAYSKKEAIKYKKPKTDSIIKTPEIISPKINIIVDVPKPDTQKIDLVIKSTADLNSLPELNPIKHEIITLQSNNERNSTRLEVDFVLFSLLREDQKRKSKSIDEQLKNYSLAIRKNKDTEKKENLLVSVKESKQQKVENQLRIKETEKKLKQIGKLLREERNKHTQPEESIFAKSEGEIVTGLVYKVQIGVYKNAISTDIFKGLTPIFEETFAEGIKYFAGAFAYFNDAQYAKDYIKSIGLTDAFVVAYYNGKRLNIEEAQSHEQ